MIVQFTFVAMSYILVWIFLACVSEMCYAFIIFSNIFNISDDL